MLINLPSRRFEPIEGEVDRSAFFPDVLACLRLPACDQLLILDCCYGALAFGPEHIGKRKFELLTSAAYDRTSPAPMYSEFSFTTTLTKCLRSLLQENPKGFSTGYLYRKVYHAIPAHRDTTKPLRFDQSPHNLGSIWLMPQTLSAQPSKSEDAGRYLTLAFRLNEDPTPAVMTELAKNLQNLPHVEQIRFEDLSAPKEQISNFIMAVVQAKKIKPLVRKMQARRKRQGLAELKIGDKKIEASKSLIKLQFESQHHSIYNWDCEEFVHGHQPQNYENPRDRRKKTGTWPPALEKSFMNDSSSGNTDSTLGLFEPGKMATSPVRRRVHTINFPAYKQADGTFQHDYHCSFGGVVMLIEKTGIIARTAADQAQPCDGRKHQRRPSSDREILPAKKAPKVD